MSLFDFFHNSSFQQELKKNRQQCGRKMACDELEAELFIDFADEMEEKRQNYTWRNDYDCGSQGEYDCMDEYDCSEVY